MTEQVQCDGSGFVNQRFGDGAKTAKMPCPACQLQQEDCERCKGSGVELRQGFGEWISDPCPDCDGTGKPERQPQQEGEAGDWPGELTVYKPVGPTGKPTLDRPGTRRAFSFSDYESRRYVPADRVAEIEQDRNRLHRALASGHGVEDGGIWEDRALAAEAALRRSPDSPPTPQRSVLEGLAEELDRVAEVERDERGELWRVGDAYKQAAALCRERAANLPSEPQGGDDR